MIAPSARPLSEGPGWWYESWTIADWMGTVFNQPLEVHAFLLGTFLGVLLAVLTNRRYRRSAVVFTLVVVLFTFGSLETVFLCSDGYTACQHVRLKPWYFFAGFVSLHVSSLGVTGYVSPRRYAANEGDGDAASLFAGVVVLALLGFAAYSFVSPDPVHPITGLSTVGGLVGSALGLSAYEWARVDDRGPRQSVPPAWRILSRDAEDAILVVGYGTVLGFGYPRVFWELGRLAGNNDFLFGSIVWARTGLPSVVSYVFVLFLVTVVLVAYRARRTDDWRLDGNRFAAIVLGFVVYAFCLFVASGYAGTVWYRVVPSAPG